MSKEVKAAEMKQILFRIQPKDERAFKDALRSRGHLTLQSWFAQKVQEELAWLRRSRAGKKAAKTRQTEL